MPTITIDKKRFNNSFEKALDDDDIMDVLSQLGTDVERITDEAIEVEIFPNRPDMLSTPGIVRSVKGILGEEKGLPSYDVSESSYEVNVEPTVSSVRPKTACAVVTGLSLSEESLDELVTLQEKLHVTYGRDRSKVALGLYPCESLTFPITFEGRAPEKISFKPLGSSQAMSAESILQNHEKGKSYSSLLDGHDVYPVFVDDNDRILSMPPIINSEKTGRVMENTDSLFIECSGFDQDMIDTALNIVVAHLSEDNPDSTIHEVTVSYDDESVVTPKMNDSGERKIAINRVNEWLGTTLSYKDIKDSLERMRHRCEKADIDNIINVSNPSYRSDIIGEADIIEDVAIGYGYNNIEPDDNRVATTGSMSKISRFEETVRDIIVGSSFQEVYTFSLCDADDQEQVGHKPILLKNSASSSYDSLRRSLLSNHLEVLSNNANYSYPQKIFEIGPVFKESDTIETRVKEEEVLCVVIAGSETGFSDLQSLVVRVGEVFDTPIRFERQSHPGMIKGRSSSMITNKDNIGIFGEIHPSILESYDINQPVCMMELSIDILMENKQTSK